MCYGQRITQTYKLSPVTSACLGLIVLNFFQLWHATGILEMARFEVDAMVSDGTSPNRRFYWLHQLADGSKLSNNGVVYWVWNRYGR